LAPHLGKVKRLVENALRLLDLSNLRGDIVHGRRDNVPVEDLSLLARIATELVRKELGLAYVPDPAHPAIENALTQFEHAKKSKESNTGGRGRRLARG
jgi:hypothetical protein